MDSSPLVSIALATYCGEKHLPSQLESLLAQAYPALEIVVADDGSTDSTWDILNHYAARDPRIRLLARTERLGVVQNFSRCFAHCRGDLISPCDQDDIWYPLKTSKLVSSMGNATLVYCNSNFIDENGEPLGQTLADKINMLDGNDPRPFLFSNSIHGHAMLFRRQLLEGNGALTCVPHDWWLAFVASSLGHIAYLDEVLVDYRRHDSSITYAAQLDRSTRLRQSRLTEEAWRLKAMAEYPGPIQTFANARWRHWIAWYNGYLSPSMFLAVIFGGNATHRAFLKEKTALRWSLKFLVGHRLKRLCRPNYYPELTPDFPLPNGDSRQDRGNQNQV